MLERMREDHVETLHLWNTINYYYKEAREKDDPASRDTLGMMGAGSEI